MISKLKLGESTVIGYADQLPGGVGDESKPEDFDPTQIEKGIKVELEHTDDHELAKEIVVDHLKEDPDYYKKLETIHKD